MNNLAIAAVITAASICAAQAMDVKLLTSSDPALKLPPITMPGGKVLNYSIGIGSGAFRHPSDPVNVIWTVGDRGPNMTCGGAKKLLGREIGDKCKAHKRGRVYPLPSYTPSI